MDYVLDFPPCGIAADDSNASTSKKLIVRRRGFGSVSFLGPISVRDSTDLADLAERNVKFDHQSIEIYPDHPDHPDHHRNSVPAGQGLNQPAIVTFENVESARKWILIRSQRGIQTHTQSVNLERTGTEFSPGPAKFRHYDASTRTLHFHVPSFSKYSLLPVQDTPRIPLNHNFVDQSSSNNATENANGIPASSMGNGTRNGREMFYAANKSVILVNNGPRRPNPFLEKSSGPSSGKSLGVSNDNDSFRPCPLPSSLVNQNSSPGKSFTSRPANSINTGKELDVRKQSASPQRSPRPSDLPPLEGDPEDVAFREQENIFNGSPHVNEVEVGRGDAAGICHEPKSLSSTSFDNVHEKTPETHHQTGLCTENEPITENSHEKEENVEISDASVALLERILPEWAKLLPPSAELKSMRNVSVLLGFLSETLWQNTNPYLLRYVRMAFKLLAALHLSADGTEFSREDSPDTGKSFLNWIRGVLPELRQSNTAADGNLSQRDWSGVHSHVLQLLTIGKLREAAAFATEQNDVDLGDLIAAVASPPLSEDTDVYLKELLSVNLTGENVYVTKILLLLSGLMSTEEISACEGLDWLTCLGLYSLFAVDPIAQPDFSTIMSLYETASFSDPGWTGPGFSNSPTAPAFRPPTLLHDIMNLFLGRADLPSLMRSLDPYTFDIGFQWLLLHTLTALDYSVSETITEQTTKRLTHALNAMQRWDLAVMILQLSSTDSVRDHSIKNLLINGITVSDFGTDLETTEKVLVDDFSLPTEWFTEGYAARAVYHDSYWEAGKFHAQLKQHTKTARIILEKLLPAVEKSGSLEAYRDLFSLVDSLNDVIVLPELFFFRRFSPLFEMLRTYSRLQQGDNMAAVLLERMEKELASAKSFIAREDVSPVMKRLVEMVEDFMQDRRSKVLRETVDGGRDEPQRSLVGRMINVVRQKWL